MNSDHAAISPSERQDGGLRRETLSFDPRYVTALEAELHEYRKESEYMKQIIKLARLWSDKRADREFHSVNRKVIQLQKENRRLKKLLTDGGIAF